MAWSLASPTCASSSFEFLEVLITEEDDFEGDKGDHKHELVFGSAKIHGK